MFDTKKLVASLKARVKALEEQAQKDANTVADRFKLVEQRIESTVKADAPEVVAEVAKLTADLASAVSRIEALEATAKATALKEAASIAKAATKKAAAKKTTTVTETAPAAEATAAVEATPVETEAPVAQ